MSAKLSPPCVRMEFRCEGFGGLPCDKILYGPFDPDPEQAKLRGQKLADYEAWVANTTGTFCNTHALVRAEQRRLDRQRKGTR